MKEPGSLISSDPVSGRSLRADIRWAGEDPVIVIGGGSRPHVGAAVLAWLEAPGKPRVSALVVDHHREEAPARNIAESVCLASGRTTLVTLGIHEDDLDPRGIQDYLDLAEKMGRELSDLLRDPL